MPAFLSMLLFDPRLNPLRYGAAITMFLCIIIAGSIPGARSEIGHYASGATLHSLAYAVLALLWFTGTRGSAMRRSVMAILAVAVMGAIDELVQSFFPYRGADVHDWMVDCSAAIVTCAIISMLASKRVLQRS